MEKLLTGADYNVCQECKDNIDRMVDIIDLKRENGQETMMSGRCEIDLIDDNEAAHMLAYDRSLLHDFDCALAEETQQLK